jgi:tetratricopeptide (TPR) repeat protein
MIRTGKRVRFSRLLLAAWLLFLISASSIYSLEINTDTLPYPRTLSLGIAHRAAGMDGPEGERLLKEAIEVFPDNPGIYFLLGKRNLSFSPSRLITSLQYVYKGIKRYARSFWWLNTLSGAVYLSLALSGFLLILITGALKLWTDLPLFSHEIEENQKRAVYLVVLIPAFFGAGYFLLALAFLALFHEKGKIRIALPLMAFLVLVTIFAGNRALEKLSIASNPLVRDVVAINEGRALGGNTLMLENATGFVPSFSLALLHQNRGECNRAVDIYRRLLEEGEDPRVLLNLGICYYSLGMSMKAESVFNKALKKSHLASAYYNLSIISRERLDFTRGDDLFVKAVGLDFERVTRFRKLWGDRDPLHFMPEYLSTAELSAFAREVSGSMNSGLLRKYGLLIALLLVTSLVLLMRRDRGEDASRCPKCGKLFCRTCQRRQLWGGMCVDCFRSMITFESDPTERIDRTLRSYNYQKTRRGILTASSFLIPGSALILGGRLLQGFIGLFFFLFFLSLLITSYTFNYHLDGGRHTWLTVISLMGLLVVYIVSNVYTRKRIRKGWL